MKSNSTGAMRRIAPRKWALLGTVAAAGIAAAVPGPVQSLMFPAAHAAGGAEAGEAGEAGLVTQEGPVGYLTHLGLFAAAHRIVAELYA